MMLSTLQSEEGIHRSLWDPPVAAVQLVGAAEAPVFTPVADGAWATVEAERQLADGEVSLRGRLLNPAARDGRELEQSVPRERHRGAGREALGQLAEAVGEACHVALRSLAWPWEWGTVCRKSISSVVQRGVRGTGLRSSGWWDASALP